VAEPSGRGSIPRARIDLEAQGLPVAQFLHRLHELRGHGVRGRPACHVRRDAQLRMLPVGVIRRQRFLPQYVEAGPGKVAFVDQGHEVFLYQVLAPAHLDQPAAPPHALQKFPVQHVPDLCGDGEDVDDIVRALGRGAEAAVPCA